MGDEAAAMASAGGDPWEYILRKYPLLLATLVGTVTYTAGFNPPGGVWQDTDLAPGGHLAGDPIIRDTSRLRYCAFFYSNATAFVSSLVVIVLVLILAVLHERRSTTLAPLRILRLVMALDLVGLLGAYAAGTIRDAVTAAYSSLLMAGVVVYLLVHLALSHRSKDDDIIVVLHGSAPERHRKVLMLLATFATSVTYVAGPSAPGGFWDADQGGHRPGDAVLKGGPHDARLKAFLICNTTAFVASLLILVLLLERRLSRSRKVRSCELYGFIVLALVGLVAAYSAGSSREMDTTFYVSALIAAVLICVLVQVAVVKCCRDAVKNSYLWQRLERGSIHGSSSETFHDGAAVTSDERHHQSHQGNLERARALVLLLATLAATITYQAGLNPPGGLWQDDGAGYKAGDPILLTTSPVRYKAFYYCNSVAFVASVVAIVLVRRKTLHQHNALEFAMVLDLLGLVGAYAAGSCRDAATSVRAVGLAAAVLIYVVVHVTVFTLISTKTIITGGEDDMAMEKRRKRLLLFAILAATITYQAGLTPPSGFLLKDGDGRRAGDPVLLHNYPRRYKSFFYCNSVSFMLSMALIIILVNPNVYRPAIRSNALSVCTAVGLVSIVGAYAAGSTQHLKASVHVFALVAAVLASVVLVVVVFLTKHKGQEHEDKMNNVEMDARRRVISNKERRAAGHSTAAAASESSDDVVSKAEAKEIHAKRKYLMLLGILVASVTYQAGLAPPGGAWQSDDVAGGHRAGDPVMHDNRRTRYLAFFYSNSTSFVASVIVILLLLPEWMHKERWWLGIMNTTIVLDLLSLVIAYAVGSSRSWRTSAKVSALVVAVLAYFVIHVMVSDFRRRKRRASATQVSVSVSV